MESNEAVLKSLFRAALDAAMPDGKFEDRLPAPPRGRTIVLGAGKAAASMASAFERAWQRDCSGLVVTPYGHGYPTRSIEVIEAAHPVPDAAAFEASKRILALAEAAGPDDLVVALISGGASSLLAMPVPPIQPADKQEVTRQLLRCGAPISEMNTVRKAMSAIKGGRLARAAAPARVVTYVISDVPGDNPAIVGSGPTIFDDRQPREALDILARYRIEVPQHVTDAIGINGHSERMVTGDVHVINSPRHALEAAAAKARSLGIAPVILGDAIEGESRHVARVMAGIARSVELSGLPAAAPCVLLSGGETTVTVVGNGRGGRNTEFLLALAVYTNGARRLSALACDTDGIDGSGTNAGAWMEGGHFDPTALDYLANNDAGTYFATHGGLIETGPTLTNVNDFRAILIR